MPVMLFAFIIALNPSNSLSPSGYEKLMLSSLISLLTLTLTSASTFCFLLPCIRQVSIQLHYQLHRSDIGNNHVYISIQGNELGKDPRKKQYKYNKRCQRHSSRPVAGPDNENQRNYQSCYALDALRQRPVSLRIRYSRSRSEVLASSKRL